MRWDSRRTIGAECTIEDWFGAVDSDWYREGHGYGQKQRQWDEFRHV